MFTVDDCDNSNCSEKYANVYCKDCLVSMQNVEFEHYETLPSDFYTISSVGVPGIFFGTASSVTPPSILTYPQVKYDSKSFSFSGKMRTKTYIYNKVPEEPMNFNLDIFTIIFGFWFTKTTVNNQVTYEAPLFDNASGKYFSINLEGFPPVIFYDFKKIKKLSPDDYLLYRICKFSDLYTIGGLTISDFYTNEYFCKCVFNGKDYEIFLGKEKVGFDNFYSPDSDITERFGEPYSLIYNENTSTYLYGEYIQNVSRWYKEGTFNLTDLVSAPIIKFVGGLTFVKYDETEDYNSYQVSFDICDNIIPNNIYEPYINNPDWKNYFSSIVSHNQTLNNKKIYIESNMEESDNFIFNLKYAGVGGDNTLMRDLFKFGKCPEPSLIFGKV